MSASPEIAPADTPDEMPFRLRLAAEVRAHLARRNWSHRQFARRIGSTPPWVARRLNGTTPMTTDDIELFARSLNVSVAEFMREALTRSPASVDAVRDGSVNRG